MVDERAGGWRLVGVVLGSVALAVAAGAIAFAVSYHTGASDGGSFEELDRFVGGAIAALVVGIPTLIAALVIGVRRTVPAGHRLATALTFLVAIVAVPLLMGRASEASHRAGLDALGGLAAVLVIVAAGAAVGGAAGIVPARRVIALLGAAFVSVGALTVVEVVRSDEVADQRRVALHERSDAPLALIGGTDLDAAFVGWDLRMVGSGYSDTVSVMYDVVDGVVDGNSVVWLMFEADPLPIDCRDGQCGELGERAGGEPIEARAQPDGVVTDVWTDVEGGRWTIEGPVDPDAAVAVLQALEAVDAEAFVAGTEEGLSP